MSISNSYVEIKVPAFGVNDSSATIVEWLFSEGDYVSGGDVIAIIETTKTTLDIEALESGILVILCDENKNVVLGQSIALIVADKNILEQTKKDYISLQQKSKEDLQLPKITQKASVKAKEYDISLEELSNISVGIIREKDIESLLIQKKQEKISNYSTEKEIIGVVEPSFLQKIKEDDSFKNLSSDEKVDLYRKHGAVIESGVSIGSESIIISDSIYMMKNSSIAKNCYVMTKHFQLGIMASIGNGSNIVAREVKIGDVSKCAYGTIVTGGFSLHSVFVVGSSSLISSHCLLDAGEGIFIGNEVGISPYVKLYTHNHWQSELEGYHSNFGPIVIKDKAYITGDCLIVPGVTVGQGATVLANSTVISDIQAGVQVSGNPAKIINRIQPNSLSMEKKERIILRIIKEMKQYVEETKVVDPNSIQYLSDFFQCDETKGKIILTFKVPEDTNKDSLNCLLFDLQTLTVYGNQNEDSDEVRNFLRRRGIRFKPIYWNYTREKSLYND